MKKRCIIDRLAIFLLVAVMVLQTTSLSTVLFATDTATGPELSDILESTDSTGSTSDETAVVPGITTAPENDSKGNLIDGIKDNLDYSEVNSEVVTQFGKTLNYYVGIVVQCIAYVITAALTLSKLLDIIYVTIPITRTYLANGYMGNAAAAGTPGMGMGNMGMGGMGMPGPMGGGMMGGGMMGGGMYGRGRYGMGGGMMGGGMGMGMGGMDGQMSMQNQPARGRIQFVSNAALNAVATESVVGTDGKGQSAFKVYISDMLISSVVTGILIVLCATGIMQKFGFIVGDFIVGVISKL